MTTTLMRQTPPEIDALFAEIQGRYQDAYQKAQWAYNALAGDAGDRGKLTRRGMRYTIPVGEAVAKVTALVAAGERFSQNGSWFHPSDGQKHLDAYAEVQATLAAIREDEAPLKAEWRRRGGWTRFFLVQNHGGHIHSSMDCSTCNRGRVTDGGWVDGATAFAWLPALSGLTEAEAVDEHGTILCSVCFPSAPVEWTVGKPAADKCSGSGQYVPPAEGRSRYDKYRVCPECGEAIAVKTDGGLRAHKPKAT